MKMQRLRYVLGLTFVTSIAISTSALASEPPVFGLTLSPFEESTEYSDVVLSQTQVVIAPQPIISSPLPWQDFTSEAGQFAILMPSPPVGLAYPSEQLPLDPTDPINEALEEGQMFFQTRLDEQGRIAVYVAGYADFDQSVDVDNTTQQIADSFIHSLDPDDRWSQQPIMLGNYSGLEVEIQTADGILSVARCYTVGQRGYFILASTLPFSVTGNLNNIEATRSQSIDVFLNSFRLLNGANS